MDEWIVRPSFGPGYGLVVEGRVVDCERGIRRPMMPTNAGPMCPHGLNRMTCLKCFHEGQAAKPTQGPKPKAPVVNPIVEQMRQRAFAERQQAAAGPVHMGTTPAGAPIEQPKAAPTRGKMPVPVLHPAAGAQPNSAPVSTQPYSYEADQGRVDRHGLWHPPNRRSIIDSLPSHPDPRGVTGPKR